MVTSRRCGMMNTVLAGSDGVGRPISETPDRLATVCACGAPRRPRQGEVDFLLVEKMPESPYNEDSRGDHAKSFFLWKTV